MHRNAVLSAFALLLVASTSGCAERPPVQCENDNNCNLSLGGRCIESPSGNQWCAYPSADCDSKLRYSTVGDDLSGQCVADTCEELVAFDVSRVGSGSHVWVAQPDGTNPLNLSAPGSNFDSSPRWSPDGRRLLYLSDNKWKHIIAVNPDGTNRVDLTPELPGYVSGAEWSPDGTHIAFLEGSKVWVMNADGSNVVPIFGPVGGELAWSPDSTQIVFTVAYPIELGGMRLLYTSPIHGPAIAGPLSHDTTRGVKEVYASWTPSQRILWSVDGGDIYTTDSRGAAKINITHDSAYHFSNPLYSQDAQRIIFTSDISGHVELWSVDVEGGEKSKITSNSITSATSEYGIPAGDFAASVSVDGQFVAFRRVVLVDNVATSDIGIVDMAGLADPVFFNLSGYADTAMFAPCHRRLP